MFTKFQTQTLLALGLAWSSAFPGAWVHAPGKFYTEYNFGYYQAKDVFDASGERIPNTVQLIPGNILGVDVPSTYTQYDATLYVEAGIGFDTDLIVSVPTFILANQAYSTTSISSSGVGDMLAGIKYKWLDLPSLGVSAVELMAGIPLGNDDKVERDSLNALRANPLGDGEWDLAVRLHYSRAFSFPLFTSASLAYRFRDLNGGTPFKNDLQWAADAGYTFSLLKDSTWLKSVIVTLAFRGIQSLVDAPVGDPVFLLSGNIVGQSQADVQPGIFLNLWKNLHLVSSYAYTFWGENTGAGWSIRNGLAWAM